MLDTLPATTKKPGVWLKLENSAEAVAAVALLFYLALVIGTLLFFGNHDLRDFAGIGKLFFINRTASSIIVLDPSFNYNPVGYDGQFAYFIALDPPLAHYYMDLDSYRYTRILYPLLARGLALGNPGFVPATLVLVNLAALTAGTWAVAKWCMRHSLSPWLALVYALGVGQVTAFSVDVSDVLAYALVAGAMLWLDKWPRRILGAGAIFGLAALARETTLLFPALIALTWLFAPTFGPKLRPRLVSAFWFSVLAVGPAVIWQIFLKLWLGNFGVTENPGLEKLPYAGLYGLRPFSDATLEVIQSVIVPATLALGIATWTLWRNPLMRSRVELWLLLSNGVIFAVLLPAVSLSSLFSAARIGLGIVLGSLYSLPYTKGRVWFYICAGLWLTATILLLLNPNSRLFRDPYVYPAK